MISELDNQPVDDSQTDGELTDTPSAKENMAPPENETASEHYESDSGDMMKPANYGRYFSNHMQGVDYRGYQRISTDEGEMDTGAEDGEILEDGEIASDQDGELFDEEDGEYSKTGPGKSSPSRTKSHKDEESRNRRSRNHKERHSKRRRSKEEGHKDKQQKKKRHRDYVDYDNKPVDEYDQSRTTGEWSDIRDRKGERSSPPAFNSPSHDSHGEESGRHKHDKDGEKHRRGSGDNRKSGRDREKSHHDREKKRERTRDGSRERSDRADKHDKTKHDKGEREGRRERHNREFRDKKNPSDGYDEYSPPGLYDSPSDEDEYGERFRNKKPKTMMSMVEGEYMDPSLATSEIEQPLPLPMPNKNNNKKKMQKKEKWMDRRRQREMEGEFEEEQQQQPPAKKKPLLQTPMEERPICRFFKEGKCQKGSECPFNHGYRQPKRSELCKYYVQSYCRKNDDCPFMHREFPCKYFHTGSTCYQGDNCKFSHAPLTEETEMALQNVLNDREDYHHKTDDFDEGYVEQKKFKKKALLGDQPLSKEAIEQRLEHMKSIPSIFDIETHAPSESPRKPKMGPPPNMIRPPGFFPDNNMSPQGGPNMRFNGPMNQGTPPRPPFMNGPPPGMESSPMAMQGPPMSGPGPMMGPGPHGMMQGPPTGPGMQGPPMGPPISQAAALVGALLRAAPMLQQYRGPATSMANDGFNQGPMNNPGMMVSNSMMGPSGPIDHQSPDAIPTSQMGGPGFNLAMNQNNDQGLNIIPNPQMASRDPRKMAASGSNQAADTDTRTQDMDMSSPKDSGDHMDEDLRQDVDLRKGEEENKKGNTTPQQDWGDDSEPNVDDMDIPAHLPPKQREMFIRIRQHTMKMNMQKNKQEGYTSPSATPADKVSQPTKSTTGKNDDNWYSSDEEDEGRLNIQESVNTSETQQPPSSFNVMQMINAVKNSAPISSTTTTTTTNTRPSDPRRQITETKPVVREPTIIHSKDGDCPWRLCRVLYVRHRIPDNLDVTDTLYKNDPRVQKMLKLQELESGQVIDHTKTSVSKQVKTDPDLPLLDPRIFTKEPSLPRPELTPFVAPVVSGSPDISDSRVKPDVGSSLPPRPSDPRKKLGIDGPSKPVDPRMQKVGSSVPSRPLDPRLARQDSNSGSLGPAGVPGNINPASRPLDPRLARQTSREVPTPSIPPPVSRSSTPPSDPRLVLRQNSSDPRTAKPELPPDSGINNNKPLDPRLGRVMDVDPNPPMQRQLSQSSASSDSSDSSKPKIDYRNDPRFKRKHISESNLPPETVAKRFTGQRKSSTEYSSPLGLETSKQEESGYNSYNRPRPPVSKTTVAPHNSPPVSIIDSVPVPSADITAHDILDSLQMPGQALEQQAAPDKNLKDIFKTIDPTASPFC